MTFAMFVKYQRRDEDVSVINDSNATLFISGNITNHDKNLEAIYCDCHGSMFQIGLLNFYLFNMYNKDKFSLGKENEFVMAVSIRYSTVWGKVHGPLES